MAGTTAPESTPATTEDSKHSRLSQTTLVLSAALVAALIVAALWIVVDGPGPTAPARIPGASAAGPSSAGPGDGCGPAAGSQVPPVTAPDNTWQLIGTMAAPVSTAAGPLTGLDAVPLCYSADPVGALFAAANFVAGMTSGRIREQVIEKLVANGPGRDVALAEVDSGAATAGVQIAGFAFLSYQPARSATVDLALTTKGALVHLPIETTWADGDWRIVLPVTGHPFDQVQALPNIAGYVIWQGA